MYIKELANFIPNGGMYANHKWYIAIINHIEKVVKTMFGNNELFEFVDNPNEYFKNQLDVMFAANDFNYSKIFNALTAEYNPVWNVESEESLTYDKTNTGTQDISGSNTGTQGVSGTNTGTQGVSGSNTGTQSTAGSNTGTQTTADTTTNTTTESNTTYDSNTEYEKGKVVSTNGGNIQRTDNLANSETRTDNLAHSETRTDNLAHSETRTNNLAHSETRTDNLAHSETREDDLSEHYEEVKKRGGNIGVTRSDELAKSETDFRKSDAYNFTMIVAHDIADFISYGV